MKKRHLNDLHWGVSLRSLPWENFPTKMTLSQNLISLTIHKWYEGKHPSISKDEVTLINNRQVSVCPNCGSSKFHRDGYRTNGIQRFRCNECRFRFTPLTNTIFQDYKIPISMWIEYLIFLFEFHSLKSSSRDNRNAITTGRYWLFKVFSVLQGIQDDVMLEGDVYIDEMFFPVIKSKEYEKDGKKLRGISRNKIAVASGRDNHNHILLIVENTSKPSEKSTLAAFEKHIRPGSHLIHDGEKSHNALIEKLKLTSTVYKSDELKGLKDKENPLNPINEIHRLSKRYMKMHGGYNRDNLQDWMNLIWLVLSEPSNRYEKVQKFLEMALNSPKKVKFREVMCKNSRK